MSSEYKKRKIKSKHVVYKTLKTKGDGRCKGILFYTPSQRKYLQDELRKELEDIKDV